MKIILILFLVTLPTALLAKDYLYKVQENDQLGMILLSIGHKKLWPKDGKVNQFKKSSSLRIPGRISEGTVLKINEADIIFKKNVITEGQFITFKKKIRTLPEFDELQTAEKEIAKSDVEVAPPSIEVVSEEAVPVKEEVIHSLNLYPGIGAFVASDRELDRGVQTSTFTGLQPLLQLKGIYSNSSFGSVGLDLLTKKIINDTFSFPVNFDYRVQLLPKWNLSDNYKLALSHSVLQHSYVGKSNATEIAYKLKSNFVGLGLVLPRRDFWFELYVEKAYTGKTTSGELTQKASSGYRLDSEIVYSFESKWSLIPGINYYNLKDTSTDYKLSVLEVRLVLAHEFEF